MLHGAALIVSGIPDLNGFAPPLKRRGFVDCLRLIRDPVPMEARRDAVGEVDDGLRSAGEVIGV